MNKNSSTLQSGSKRDMSGTQLSKCTQTRYIISPQILSSKEENSDVWKINTTGKTLQVLSGKCGIRSCRSKNSRACNNCWTVTISFRFLKMVSKAPGTLVNGPISPSISKSWKSTATKDKATKTCTTPSFSKRASTKLFSKLETRGTWMLIDTLRRLGRFLILKLLLFLESLIAEPINWFKIYRV